MASVEIDMDKVVAESAQQLGAQIGMLTLQLGAERAGKAALAERVDELEKALGEKVAEFEQQLAAARDVARPQPADTPAQEKRTGAAAKTQG